MPLYEYRCTECGQSVEVIQRHGDPPPDGCENCGGSLERQVSAPAFQFKGTGWYVTDYARKSGGEKKDGDSGAKETSKPSDKSKPGEKKEKADGGGSAKAASSTGD